jgi:hypothetical protein
MSSERTALQEWQSSPIDRTGRKWVMGDNFISKYVRQHKKDTYFDKI